MPICPENIGRRSKLGTSEELSKAVRRFQEGEREVFNDIYKMSYGYLHTCVSRALDNENTVKDMLQETYLEIYRSIGQLRQPDSFLHWAAAIAGRKCIAWANREKRLPVEDTGHAEEYLEDVAESEEFLPETILQNKEKQDLLRKMIDRLPPMQKICIVAYYYHELSQQEIAEELGVPLNTVKSYLNRARKKIRTEVLELEEQKDIKLYSMAPFFLLLLDMEAEACEISAMPEKLARMAGAHITAGKAKAAGAHIAAGKAKAAGIHVAAGKLAAIVTATALTAGGAALVLMHPWTGSVMTDTEESTEQQENSLTASGMSETEGSTEKGRETSESPGNTIEEGEDGSDKESELISLEYEPDEIREEGSFGTDQEAYHLVLEIDTFKLENYNSAWLLKREGDWIRLSKGGDDPIYEITYRAQENAEEFMISLLEFRLNEYYSYRTESELSQEIAAFIHEMTQAVETDKYEIPVFTVDGQACNVTCYEYPIRRSMLGGEDLFDLYILYRVDMPNGDALFIRGLRYWLNTLDYYMTRGMDVYLEDDEHPLEDVTLERFKEYLKEYIVENESIQEEYKTYYDPLFKKLEKDLCELIECLVVTRE